MRITDAARELGVHPDTLRAWERRELFKARRDWTGARRYTAEDLSRLRQLIFPEPPAPATEPPKGLAGQRTSRKRQNEHPTQTDGR